MKGQEKIRTCKMFLFRCFILCNNNNTISCPYNRAIQIREKHENMCVLSKMARVIPSEQKQRGLKRITPLIK